MFNTSYDDSEILYDNIKVVSVNEKKDSLQINFSTEELDTICLYVNNLDSDIVSHSALVNAQTMFELMDTKPYNVSDELRSRIEYITLVLEARVTLSLNTRTLIKNHVLRNCDIRLKSYIEEEIIKDMANAEISRSTCKYLNSLVYENLIEGYSTRSAKKLSAIFEKKESGGYKRITDFSKDLKELVSEINKDIRVSEEFMREGQGFDLDNESIKPKIKSIMKKLRAPSNKLKTGLQYLNRMLNGGFESGRSYLIMGVTGVGKSIILLSIAMWIKRYNDIPKHDGMKQAVLFISQENSEAETFERLFNMNVSGDDIRNFSDDEIEDGLRNIGLLVDKENDNSSINFIFKYFDDKEIGVSDINEMITGYENQGIQIIAVVQDYIERLQPKEKYTEVRFALGSLATEMSELAKARNIPFISAAQLNRMATSIIDNAIINNKTNTTKLLGRDNISESYNMLKNIDAAIIINREIDDRDDEERQYMGFKLIKFRGKPNKDRINLFIHPFDENNGILLPPDLEGKPLSRFSMEDFNPMGINNLNKGGRPDFQDYDSEADEFMASFVDIISEDYKDTDKNTSKLYKMTEVTEKSDEFKVDMSDINISDELNRLEYDHIKMRKHEMKELKNSNLKKKDMLFVMTRKTYQVENGLIRLHRIGA